MTYLIDNGHGTNTPGKRSVDGTLREGVKAREIARGIVEALKTKGYDARLVTPEDADIRLNVRVRRVNAVCEEMGASNVCVVSIHLNAQGFGKYWTPAQGWSVHCSKGRKAKDVSTGSKRLAGCLYDEAATIGRNRRAPSPTQKYWVQDLAICRDTLCPAALTENFFMTNQMDLAFVKSAEGVQGIIDAHVNALIKYSEL